MSNFKRRKSSVNFKKMTNKMSPNTTDPNQFSYALNNKGVFECEMRFIEPPQEEINGELDGVPFITLMSHKYKDHAGREVTHQCRKMLPLEDGISNARDMCPICTYVAPLWNEGREEEYRELKSKAIYVANVLIIKNPDNRETEGKIFQFWFGYQIYDIITKASVGEGLDEGFDPFDIDEGHIFVFTVKKKGKYNNYESSKFRENPTPLTDEQLEYCDKNSPSLLKHLKARLDKVKSYDDLTLSFYKETGEHPEGWTPPSSVASGREETPHTKEEKTESSRRRRPSREVEEDESENESVSEESNESDAESFVEEESEETTDEESNGSKDSGEFWDDV